MAMMKKITSIEDIPDIEGKIYYLHYIYKDSRKDNERAFYKEIIEMAIKQRDVYHSLPFLVSKKTWTKEKWSDYFELNPWTYSDKITSLTGPYDIYILEDEEVFGMIV